MPALRELLLLCGVCSAQCQETSPLLLVMIETIKTV